MNRTITRARRKSSLLEDLQIIWRGAWGFLLQSLGTFQEQRQEPHD